jgi:hypothetical protein
MAGQISGTGYELYKDGSLRKVTGNKIGSPMVWYKRDLKDFDKEGNPVWGGRNYYSHFATPHWPGSCTPKYKKHG